MADSGVELTIEPRRRDLGGFTVARVLPYAKHRMVGPFVFFDEMGPADFAPGTGVDVRPHPHIGLATVTYLFEGELRHRDNLGFDQIIRPGDVNWMTAGRGIVHSERTDADRRAAGQRLHGIQCWVALPDADAEMAPSFRHYPSTDIPDITRDGARIRVVAGTAFGATSPVETRSRLFYAACEAEEDGVLEAPEDHRERALYVVSGAISTGDMRVDAGRMVVLRPGAKAVWRSVGRTRVMMLGGDPVGPRKIWWNFVGSDDARLETARRAWAAAADAGFQGGDFTLPPGEREFIPLPEA